MKKISLTFFLIVTLFVAGCSTSNTQESTNYLEVLNL